MIDETHPLLDWRVRRAAQSRGALAGLLTFAVLFYGGVALSLITLGGHALLVGDVEPLLTMLHYEALAANAIILLFWAPSRLAQQLARERELDTLSLLRLSGLSGRQLALGFVGGSLALPLLLCALTLPVALLGAGGHCGPMGPIRVYPVLLLLALCLQLAGGLVGLAGKSKAQNAGGALVFVAIAALGLGGLYRVPQLELFGVLGPWGAMLTTVPLPPTSTERLTFELPLFGARLPGDLVQLAFLALLARLLLAGLARRFEDRAPSVLLGAPATLGLTALLLGLAAATYEPGALPVRETLCARLLLIAVFVAPLAVELPVRYADLVRGAARRDPDDPPWPEERLLARRLLAGPLLTLGATLLLLFTTDAPQVEGVRKGALVAAVVISCAWVFAALTLQAARLWTRDRGAPMFFAFLALAALWGGPFFSSFGLEELGLDAALIELPRVINPLYAVKLASFIDQPVAGLDPLALAISCAVLHGFGALGLWLLVQSGARRARELADSLVTLPADADDAPGSLERRCANGHLHAALWATCPHCPDDRVSSATQARGP